MGSLHASTIAEVPSWRRVEPRERELFVEFEDTPDEDAYLKALAETVEQLARISRALVLSLGYDIVASDPTAHGTSRRRSSSRSGASWPGSGLPICVVQEGGYSLEALAECSHAFASGLLNSRGTASDSIAYPVGAYAQGIGRQAEGSKA